MKILRDDIFPVRIAIIDTDVTCTAGAAAYIAIQDLYKSLIALFWPVFGDIP